MDMKTVLLVEDDILVGDIIISSLSTKYCVLMAVNCSEALKCLKNLIHLALIDYILPDGDGFDIVKAIKTEKPGLPIILMTAYSHENVVLRALRLGITDYIKKPLSLKYLTRKIHDILEGNSLSGDMENEVTKSRKEFLIDGVEDYIATNYMKDLRLEKLAKMACMSKFAFCKAFKEKFGQNYISFLNAVRIKNASELLRNPDLSITDVAFFVGYESVEYFDRRFRALYGTSPNKYRKSISR
jgi:two-component system response regulator YesN